MTAKKLGGLGRGLGAIYDDFDVSDLSEEDGDDKRLETVKLDELRPGSTQPRSTMTEEGLQELADSIRQQGIISPIIKSTAAELPIAPRVKKYTGRPTSPARLKQISWRFVRLKASLVLTLVKSFGTGT